VIEEDRSAAEAGDPDLEGHTRAERWLFEDQREGAARQRGAMPVWVSLDFGREMKEFADLSGTPFRAGEQIVCERKRCSSVHVLPRGSQCDGLLVRFRLLEGRF